MFRRKLSLSIESLEPRELLYANAFVDYGMLTIDADSAGGEIHVYYLSGVVFVTSPNKAEYFDADSIDRIIFRGSESSDHFENHTSIGSAIYGNGGDDTLAGGAGDDLVYGGDGDDLLRGRSGNDYIDGGLGDDTIEGETGDDKLTGGHGNDWIDGGSGHDRLVGGNGQDTIRGGAGDDLMWSHEGDDVLYGGAGDDTLYGDGGNDTLHGDAGDDLLFGGSENDSLYGGSGNDAVHGGDGADGVFGGQGTDMLEGGNGADRILQHWSSRDRLMDKRAEDAVINFRDGVQTFEFGLIWEAGEFTDAEIELIDQALSEIHYAIGNTKLLKSADGGWLTFYRQGQPDDWTGIAGWNQGGTKIYLVPESFSDDDWLYQVVFHEFGHNWDDVDENHTVGQFRALSGWRQSIYSQGLSSSDPRYIPAEDDWWYVSSSDFAREYGKTSPKEDFATVFAAYFMDTRGSSFSGYPGPAGIPDKLAYMESFVTGVV